MPINDTLQAQLNRLSQTRHRFNCGSNSLWNRAVAEQSSPINPPQSNSHLKNKQFPDETQRIDLNSWAKTQMMEYPLRQSCKNKPLPRFQSCLEDSDSSNEYVDRIEICDDIKHE